MIEDIEEYQTVPGLIILCLRIVVMLSFLFCLRDTMLHEFNADKLNFFLHFGKSQQQDCLDSKCVEQLLPDHICRRRLPGLVHLPPADGRGGLADLGLVADQVHHRGHLHGGHVRLQRPDASALAEAKGAVRPPGRTSKSLSRIKNNRHELQLPLPSAFIYRIVPLMSLRSCTSPRITC